MVLPDEKWPDAFTQEFSSILGTGGYVAIQPSLQVCDFMEEEDPVKFWNAMTSSMDYWYIIREQQRLAADNGVIRRTYF